MYSETEHVGFFAVPVDEVAALMARYEAMAHSLQEGGDDYLVLENQLYERARAASIHHRELVGRTMCGGAGALSSTLYRSVWSAIEREVFTADQSRTLSEKVSAWERRRGGIDKVVQHLANRTDYTTNEAMRVVYDAFKEVLAAATSHDCGFVWASLYPQAEARLAERRQQAEIQREAEERASQPPPEREGPTIGQQLDAYIERMHGRRADEEFARLTGSLEVRLCLIPGDAVDPIRESMVRAREAYGADHQDDARRHVGRARDHAARVATWSRVLRTTAQYVIAGELFDLIKEQQPEAVSDTGVFTADQAARLCDALHQLESQHGEPALIEHLTGKTATQRRLAPGTVRLIRTALTAARDRDSGFVVIMDHV